MTSRTAAIRGLACSTSRVACSKPTCRALPLGSAIIQPGTRPRCRAAPRRCSRRRRSRASRRWRRLGRSLVSERSRRFSCLPSRRYAPRSPPYPVRASGGVWPRPLTSVPMLARARVEGTRCSGFDADGCGALGPRVEWRSPLAKACSPPLSIVRVRVSAGTPRRHRQPPHALRRRGGGLRVAARVLGQHFGAPGANRLLHLFGGRARRGAHRRVMPPGAR